MYSIKQLNDDKSAKNAQLYSVEPLPHSVCRPQQKRPQWIDLIIKMTTVCVVLLGSIVLIGTILVAIGLISGILLSGQEIMMLSSMLLGIAYSFIMLCGLVFCVIALLFISFAKVYYHADLKENLMVIIGSVIAIYIAPFVFLNIVKMLFG